MAHRRGPYPGSKSWQLLESLLSSPQKYVKNMSEPGFTLLSGGFANVVDGEIEITSKGEDYFESEKGIFDLDEDAILDDIKFVNKTRAGYLSWELPIDEKTTLIVSIPPYDSHDPYSNKLFYAEKGNLPYYKGNIILKFLEKHLDYLFTLAGESFDERSH